MLTCDNHYHLRDPACTHNWTWSVVYQLFTRINITRSQNLGIVVTSRHHHQIIELLTSVCTLWAQQILNHDINHAYHDSLHDYCTVLSVQLPSKHPCESSCAICTPCVILSHIRMCGGYPGFLSRHRSVYTHYKVQAIQLHCGLH